MAEIHQPAPIKPTWPTRRDGRPKQRKQPQDANERKRHDSGKEVREESQRSHIDDYA